MVETMKTFKENYERDAEVKRVYAASNDSGKGKYLPWATAWALFKEQFPNGTFIPVEYPGMLTKGAVEAAAHLINEGGSPESVTALIEKIRGTKCYEYDPVLGYRVAISLSLDGMNFLPPVSLAVMDSKNNSMLDHPYEIPRKNYVEKVSEAKYTDIHNSTMRCLVKAIAIHTGIGLTLWMKDDSEVHMEESVEEWMKEDLMELIRESGYAEKDLLKRLKANALGVAKSVEELNAAQYNFLNAFLKRDILYKKVQAEQKRQIEEKIALSQSDLIRMMQEKRGEKLEPVERISSLSIEQLGTLYAFIMENARKAEGGKAKATRKPTAKAAAAKAESDAATAAETVVDKPTAGGSGMVKDGDAIFGR